MAGRQWSAKWIWGGEEVSPRNEWRCFRKTFHVPEGGENGARLHISADSRYVLFVNGERAGRGPVRSWPAEQFYDTYDIGRLLKPGRTNAIAVLVLHFGVANFYYIRGRGGLLAELEGGGRTGTLAATDGSWRTSRLAAQDPRSPRMSCQQGFADIYDARKWDERWTDADYDDADWPLANIVGPVGSGPWKKIVPRDIPFLTEETVYPSRVASLQAVKPPRWAAALDVRNGMLPDSANHADRVKYAGFLATVLTMRESGKLTLGFPNGRVSSVWVDGRLCGGWYGDQPERYCDLELAAGDHFVLIDVSGGDHGGSFHIAADSGSEFVLRSPAAAAAGNDTPFAIVGPFHYTIDIDHQGVEPLDLEQPDYVRAKGIKHERDLESFREWVRPLPGGMYSEDDVFGSNVWRTAAVSYAVPPELDRCVQASPEPAVVPRFDGMDTELVIDFGKEWSGFIGFEAEAPEGTVIDLYGLEYMKDDYRQHTYGLDNTIRYICRGGRQQYISPVRRGFRYLVVTIRQASAPVRLHRVFVNQSAYPVAQNGYFRCSDALLNDIWEISRHTTLLCMEDTFVDCPSYEQVFWVGDSRNEALVNYYVFGALDIVKRCLNLVPGSGEMTPLYVDQVPSAWNSVIPNWTFFWVTACAEYAAHTGDRAFAARIWPAVRHTLTHYLRHVGERGLLDIKGWNLLDWAPIDQPNDGIVTHQNMFLAKALRDAAGLAAAAGVPQEAAPLAERADALRKAIDGQLWDEERQAYIDCIHADGRRSATFSMQTQVVAYLCDIAEGKRKERLEGYLVAPPASFVQIGSPFMSFFYYEALVRSGQYDRMIADIRHSYGMMIENGATTCWEMYPNFSENRANPNQLTRSHCHAWSAAPGYFLGAVVLGIRRLDDGWKRAAVAPEPCGLQWARGAVPLPQGGRIEVSWRIDGGRMELHVSAPDDVELDIRIPDGLSGSVTRSATRPSPLAAAAGMTP